MRTRRLFCRTVVILLVAALADSSRAQLTDGLVGYWPLNDLAAVDASGNGLDGTLNGNLVATSDRFGDPAGAILFPGEAGSHIDLGDPPEFDISGAMTLSAWVLLDPENMTNNGRILSKQAGGGARSWSLNIESGDAPATFQIAPDGGSIASVSGSMVPRDEWVHLAGVFRPGVTQEVYINGVLDAANTIDVPLMQHSANGNSVLIGSRNACGNCAWPGAIDDVAMWERDLSGAEISELFASGIFGEVVPGDVNGDGSVNNDDYVIIRDNFLDAVTSREMGDLTFDGVVDWADFRQWKENPAAGAAAAAVPEPAGLVLALLGAGSVGLLTGRRAFVTR